MIRALLLCGGKSSRFGADKLIFSHSREGGNPIPIAVQSARNLMQGAGNVLAVIPPGATHPRGILQAAGCEILESPHTARGLGASLAAGVAASAVKERLEQGALIAAPMLRGGGARGHPVGFSRALREELIAIDGDEGARSVIAAHRGEVSLVEVDDPGIVKDIDTPADL